MRAQRASKPLPDRVLLYGVTGSGKSTAALAIGARTGHPVTLVDELTWLPGWVPVEAARQREVIGEIVAGERWLLDSSYGDWLDFVLPRTQLVIGLDYPRWLSLGRRCCCSGIRVSSTPGWPRSARRRAQGCRRTLVGRSARSARMRSGAASKVAMFVSRP